MSESPNLYPDNLYRIYIANNVSKKEKISIDSRHVLPIYLNDDIFYHLSLLKAYDPDFILNVEINPATGNRFIVSSDYVFFYYALGKDYYNLPENEALDLAYNTVKKYLSKTEANYALYMENLVDDPAYNRQYEAQRRLTEELADLKSEFTLYDGLEDEIVTLTIENPAEPKIYDLTFQYSPEMDIRTLNFHNLILNEHIPLVMENNQIRVFEFAYSLPLLLVSVKETADKSLESLVIKIFNNEQYDTALFYKDMSQLIVINTKTDIYTDFPPTITLDGLHPLGPIKTNVTINWSVYNLKLEFNIFLYAIMTDRLLMRFFSVSEVSSLYFLKSRSEILFTIDEVNYKLDIHPQRLIADQNVNIGEENVQIKAGTYSIAFTLSNVVDEFRALSAAKIITGLISNFIKKSQKEIIKYFKFGIREFTPRYIAGFRKGEEEGHKIYALQAAARDIFVSGYARVCLGNNQGVVIPQDELDDWLENNPGQRYLPFPLTEKQKKWIRENPNERKIPVIGKHALGITVINFACPEGEYSHPGVKQNISLPNKEKYPLIPCCYKHNQFEDKNSNLYKYIHNIPPEENVEVILTNIQKKEMKSEKILPLGREGKVPDSIINLFSNYGYDKRIVRVGAYEASANSFIHCIMYGLYDLRYNELFLTPRENFTIDWRRSLVQEGVIEYGNYPVHDKEISLALVRQELCDETDEQIVSMVEDSYNYDFDSKLFYRLLENEYDINIFVIYQAFGGEPTIEIPQHKIVHIRERRLDLPSIVIFKHHASKDAPAHYELLRFHQQFKLDAEKGELNTQILFKIFGDIYQNFVFSKASNNEANSTIKIHKDVYSSFSVYNALVNANIIPFAQYLDRYCKCRGYMVKIGKYHGTILCMPQQPRDLPITAEIVAVDTDILSLFGKVSRVHVESINGQRRMVGTWIPINDYELGFYIPVIVTPKITKLELTILADRKGKESSNPLFPWKTQGNFSHYLQIENQLQTFLSVINLLYRKFGLKTRNKVNKQLNNTIEKYKELADEQKEELGLNEKRIKRRLAKALPDFIPIEVNNSSLSRKYYNTLPLNKYINHLELLIHEHYREKLVKRLNSFRQFFDVELNVEYEMEAINIDFLTRKTFDEIMIELAKLTNETVVKDEKIVLNSEKLKKDMIYYLESFLIKQPANFYTTIIVNEKKVRIFTTMLTFELWVNTKSNPNLIITNASLLGPDRSDPHIYQDQDGRLYLIQNVLHGELQRAINVAISWRDGNGNPGFQSEATNEQVDYTTFKIIGTTLQTDEAQSDLSIIAYPEAKYGALLGLSVT